jgi:hypothetical protein
MLSRFAHFLLKKNKNAAMVAFLCSILPVFLGSISVIIVALVALRKGARDGFFVLAWGILPLLAQAFVEKSYVFFAAAILAYVLVWAMAVILRRCSSWSTLLEVCVLLSVAVVLVSFVFQSQIEQWWVKQIHNYMQMMVDQGLIQTNDKLSEVQVNELANITSGVEMLLLLLMAGFKLAVSRWWEGSVFKKISLRQELLHIKLNRWELLLFFLLVLAAAVTTKMIFVTVLIPVAGFYAIAGLCMLHYWMQGYKYARLALLGFYMVLIVFPYVVVLPLILGLVDSGLNLRVKLIRKEV